MMYRSGMSQAGTDARLAITESSDEIAIAELGSGSAAVRDVLTSGRPKLITENGVGVAVILDTHTYEAMRVEATHRLLGDLQRAIRQADAGQLVEHEEVVRGLRDRFRDRVSVELQKRLDQL